MPCILHTSHTMYHIGNMLNGVKNVGRSVIGKFVIIWYYHVQQFAVFNHPEQIFIWNHFSINWLFRIKYIAELLITTMTFIAIIRLWRVDQCCASCHVKTASANEERCYIFSSTRDDVIKWRYFLRHWPFVWGIHRSTRKMFPFDDDVIMLNWTISGSCKHVVVNK